MLKRRLKSLFSAGTAPQGDEGPAITQDSPSVTPDESTPATAEEPEDGTDMQAAGSGLPIKLGIPVDSADLLAEVQSNAATAKSPGTGNLARFQTAVWDSGQLATVSLPKWTRENLNEAYIDIELANRLVWLGEVTGRVSKETAESHAKLCVSISKRLEAVLSQTAADTAPLSPAEEPVAPTAIAQPAEVTIEPEVVGTEPEMASTSSEVANTEPVAAKSEGQADKTEAPAEVTEEPPQIELHEEDETLFLGKTKLFITRGANSSQIAGLTRSLCETQGIRVISSGGSSRGRSTVTLSLDRPLPLLKLLKAIPLVKTASKEKTDVEVSLATAG